MSHITIPSEKIKIGYLAFQKQYKQKIERRQEEAIERCLNKNEKNRRGIFGFLVKKMTREMAIAELKEGLFPEWDAITYRDCIPRSIFSSLYLASFHADSIEVSIDDFRYIAAWLTVDNPA